MEKTYAIPFPKHVNIDPYTLLHTIFITILSKSYGKDKDTAISGDFRSAVTKDKDKDAAISGDFGNLRHSSFSRGATLWWNPHL